MTGDEVDVATLQAEQLSSTKGPERGEQDKDPEVRTDRFGELVDLLRCRQWPLARVFLASTADDAWVPDDHGVADRRVQDGAQEAVGLGRLELGRVVANNTPSSARSRPREVKGCTRGRRSSGWESGRFGGNGRSMLQGCARVAVMEDIVAVAVSTDTGAVTYFLTWGRIQDRVDPETLENLIMSVVGRFSIPGTAVSARLCDSLQEASSAPYFFEYYFGFCQRPFPFGKRYTDGDQRSTSSCGPIRRSLGSAPTDDLSDRRTAGPPPGDQGRSQTLVLGGSDWPW